MKKRGFTNFLLVVFVLFLGLGVAGFLTNWYTDFSFFDPADSDTSSSGDSTTSSVEELSYKITFSVAATNTVPLDGDGIKALASVDGQLMSITATESLYRFAPDSIKFGTASLRGHLIFTLPEHERILSVAIEAVSYGSDMPIMIVNGFERALTSSSAEYVFDHSAVETATIDITSKNSSSSRFYVSSITIVHTGMAIEEPSAPLYERIEAERYEVVIPMLGDTNKGYCLYAGSFAFEDVSINSASGANVLINSVYSFDADLTLSQYSGEGVIEMFIYLDVGMSTRTNDLVIAAGEYGQYTIATSQTVDQDVVFAFAPIYEYVLVD